MRDVTRILFICHGNICRSPMAEYVMKDLVAKSGLEDHFIIDSAATSTEELGCDVYPPARKVMAQHGVICPTRRARQMIRADIDAYDYLICMDERNLRNLGRMFGNAAVGKTYKLLSFAGRDDDVSDPWYSRDFETCYQDVLEGCEALLAHSGR